jgi:hypothetical protein
MVLAVGAARGDTTGELAAPVRIEAGGEPINVDIGHAAPHYADFDGDKVLDLLVGQFGEGKLRVYRNLGTDAEPKFGDVSWFEAGGELGTVPSG